MNKPTNNKEQQYINAKNKVKNVKVFYVHLIGYIILVMLLLYNLYIIDEHNQYANFFTWFNLVIIAAWSVFIFLHGWNVFKGRLFFKKDWEDKKVQEFLDRENKNTN